MLKHLRYVVTAAFVVSVTMASTAAAQETLGFTIDPTQGIPGDTVSGQVNPEDIAAHCVTDLAEFQARFQALLEGPFGGGSTEVELFQRFFPGQSDFIFENCDQLAYSLTGITVFGIAQNFNGAAETAFPQSFVLTFADVATQEPVGELSSFDPVTGTGTVVTPNVTPGLWAVAAVCIAPTLDLDALEAGIRETGDFLRSIGLTDEICDPNIPEFAAFIEEFLGPGADLFAFLEAIGPEVIQNIVEFDALGVQLFTVLTQPETKDDCKKGGWRQFAGLGFTDQGECIEFVNTGIRPTTTTTAPTTTTTTTSTTTTTIGSPSGAFLEDAANLLD